MHACAQKSVSLKEFDLLENKHVSSLHPFTLSRSDTHTHTPTPSHNPTLSPSSCYLYLFLSVSHTHTHTFPLPTPISLSISHSHDTSFYNTPTLFHTYIPLSLTKFVPTNKILLHSDTPNILPFLPT